MRMRYLQCDLGCPLENDGWVVLLAGPLIEGDVGRGLAHDAQPYIRTGAQSCAEHGIHVLPIRLLGA